MHYTDEKMLTGGGYPSAGCCTGLLTVQEPDIAYSDMAPPLGTTRVQQLEGQAFVFADLDASGTGQRTAEATGLSWSMNLAAGEDANDLHPRAGLMAVCAQIMAVRRGG